MIFNTIDTDLKCPYCNEKVTSGIGFRLGALENRRYRLGDTLSWSGKQLRPQTRPEDGNLSSIGYFNCDNIRCSSWQDCYPIVQQALITVKGDVITEVSVFEEMLPGQDFDIIYPEGLS